jgi:hypothetical protein
MNDQDYQDAQNDRINALGFFLFIVALVVLYHVVSNMPLS